MLNMNARAKNSLLNLSCQISVMNSSDARELRIDGCEITHPIVGVVQRILSQRQKGISQIRINLWSLLVSPEQNLDRVFGHIQDGTWITVEGTKAVADQLPWVKVWLDRRLANHGDRVIYVFQEY